MAVDKRPSINWRILSEAKEYYRFCGYKYVEVPWLVPHTTSLATSPLDAAYIQTLENEDLIGSGEQGFLQLILNGELIPDQYQTITPCFRQDQQDGLHFRHFMKCELIDYLGHYNVGSGLTATYRGTVEETVDYTIRCAATYLGGFTDVSRVVTSSGWDLVHTETGIELGSYGLREYQGHSWVYGTGVALPRLSQVWIPSGSGLGQ
jgi:hypothetical protein